MKELIVGFSKPKKWKPFAWLIMKGYNTPYSHVYAKLWSDKFERFIIYQASHTTVNMVGTQVFEQEAEIIKEFSVDITDEKRTKMIQFAIDNVGKPYGIKNAFGLAWVRICEIFGKNVRNPFADDGKTYVCCEWVGELLKDFTDIEIHEDLNNVNPREIFEILSQLASAPNS